ncbi:arylsulfatase [Candidatus Poriferisocius sp.]|uniref:arylsulfatase n=1 Tax=Candidatus Poriferisocius sp. TaxID=3101276 RepID=UPI003B01E3F2
MSESDIGLTLAESRSSPVLPPYDPDAPNVLVMVLDDLGFAQLGCYGSDIDTPNLDRLAARGLRFTNFHTTALCSPTRACLLTGRNHHRVGVGMLTDLPINFPGYTGRIPPSAGTLAQHLSAEGWATYAVGKWHLTPRDERAVGPYKTWPTGTGFDHYYGFLNGETNQWTPQLVRDQSYIEPPATPEEGYHLDADLADQAISYLRELRLADARRPFLLWYATGTPHAPHQAPPEWIDRYAGRFDRGWDAWREAVLARQKRMGIIPEDIALSDRPEWVQPWDRLDADLRRLYARMMEVYAGFLSHADHHIGRLLDHLERTGDLDNTVIVLISDNGSSAEGGPNGSWNQVRHYISDEPDDLDLELSHYDDLGGFRSSGHYPWGWALAGNTPFRRWKRYTFEGGVRDPMIISWPDGLPARGELRHQYCHVTDVMPTILDLVGMTPPNVLGGIEQMSFDGSSMRAVLDDAGAPEHRITQYYECWGSRAMYHNGWKAVTNHVNQLTAAERDAIAGSHDFADDRWELFNTVADPTESCDRAEQHPERLAELVRLWNEAADRNGVLPLDDTAINRMNHLYAPWMSLRSRYELVPGDKVHEATGPLQFGGYRAVAAFPGGVPADASGVICEQGDWISGWALFLAAGELRWVAVVNGREYRVAAPVPGQARFTGATVTPTGEGLFTVMLTADGTEIGRGDRPVPLPASWAPDGAFLTVGYGRPFPVCDDYEPPAPCPAAMKALTIDTGTPPPFDFDVEMARAMRHQ